MTTLSNLIARLEAAKEGSRELDAWIFCSVEHPDKKPEHNLFYKNREEWGVFVSNAPSPGMTFHDAPHYTTSLDAALTLVPDGMCWRYDSALGWAQIFDLGRSPIEVADSGDAELTSYHAPLALCIAALKAREARR